MKLFTFRQENCFGDTISLVVSAENEENALSEIKKWILKNTKSREDMYKSSYNYMSKAIKKEKRKIMALEEHERTLRDNLLNRKTWSDKDGTYSINDFDNEELNLYDKFGQSEARDTYIWTFENKSYSLKEMSFEDQGVLTSQFIYTGM